MQDETGVARAFRLVRAAPWLILATILGCAGGGRGALRSVVVPYPEATSLIQVDDAVCQRVCPAAPPPERLASCHATSAEAVRRVMSNNVRNTHLVCAYAGEGMR